ncbi:MAG TPA: carbohydrate-binding protein [Hymenobacter sp.]|jgi:pectate lyase|uniref:InlB B-repeat-containing protein n=1 Tax=Hymenobacter sp. TaxID=1898978 RepID=UPI002EDB252B
MKINLFSFFSLLLLLLVGFGAAAQTSCAVAGWASQNGGTTGGGSATPTVVSNYTDFKNAVTNAAVKVVHISGTITFPAAGRINFQDQTGKTIYGLPGSRLVALDRTASGSGTLYIKRCSNIIFRNITFEGPGAFDTDGNDHLTIDNCTNVWVDHCDFQDGVDGNLDVKNLADYISITWCRFVYLKPPIPGGSGGADDHRFSNLFGSSDGATGDRGKLRITMQNCWWAQGCRERMPRVRFGKVHIVNNYFSSAGNNHCIRAGFEADLRVESNYFENVNNPIDLFENDFTAVSELNNVFVGTSGGRTGQGTAFTPPYALTITPAANVKSTVSGGAGATLTSSTSCGGGTTPPPTTYTLTTTASPAAGGTISRSPNASSYAAGTVVTLTATPAAGYTFAGWSGAASGSSATTTVTVNANSTATATFTATPTSNFTLTVSRNPVAGGTVAQSPNAASYAPNTVVTLTATPAAGYVFSGWSGASTATTASTTVTMNANKSITANFTASGGGGGSTTLRIEEAATETSGFCGANGSRQNSYTGADNGFYINLSNSAARGIDWNVNAPAAGTYTLRFRYANAGGSSATTARVLVNGASAVASVPFPKTAAWTTWTTTTASVTLRAGVNAIRLETTVAAEFANIDWLEVTGNSPTAAACSAARMAPAAPAATLDESTAARLYPNPASDRTAVKFALTESGPVAIQVYDFRGQRVKTLTERVYSSGSHAIAIDDLGLKPGPYTLVVVSGQGKQTLRLEVR